ncbi:hypothetical protein Tco_1264990 [Tanacetum coccineum]
MGTPTQVYVRSCPNISARSGRTFRISTPVFVEPESSTQADRAQSSRVLVLLPEDPYETIRHAYLDGTNTESEPFKDPIDTETPELPLTVALPISLSKSTLPVLVPILHRTTRMVVRVLPAMSSGLSASIAEVEAMSESAFRKRFRSSYESSPSVSPPDLPSRKRYQGTSELVEDSEEDNDIEESLDSDSVGEDAEDEGSTTEDEDPAARDEGLAMGVEGPGMDDESYGLDDESHGMDDEGRGLDDEIHSVESDGLGLEEEEEEVVPGSQQQAALVVGTTVSAPLGLRYGALRRRELALKEDQVYSTFEVRHGSGSAPESERPKRGENQDLRLQLVEEESCALELAVVDKTIRKGQGARGDFRTGLPRIGRAEIVDQVKYLGILNDAMITYLEEGLEVDLIRHIQGVGYGVLEFLGVGNTHGYAVSSLMDTVYWLSESLIFKISLFKL